MLLANNELKIGSAELTLILRHSWYTREKSRHDGRAYKAAERLLADVPEPGDIEAATAYWSMLLERSNGELLRWCVEELGADLIVYAIEADAQRKGTLYENTAKVAREQEMELGVLRRRIEVLEARLKAVDDGSTVFVLMDPPKFDLKH